VQVLESLKVGFRRPIHSSPRCQTMKQAFDDEGIEDVSLAKRCDYRVLASVKDQQTFVY
jgi:hypothetical protein